MWDGALIREYTVFVIASFLLASCNLWSPDSDEEFHPGISGVYYIHVSQTLGDDSARGTRGAPLKTLTEATRRIASLHYPWVLRISEGQYVEQLGLANTTGTIEGGYSSDFSDRDPDRYTTLLAPTSAQEVDAVIYFVSSNIMLDGVWVRSLNPDAGIGDTTVGVVILSSSATIRNSTVETRSTTVEDLGIYALESTITVDSCTFQLNGTATQKGMYADASEFTVTNSRFLDNNSTDDKKPIFAAYQDRGGGRIENNDINLHSFDGIIIANVSATKTWETIFRGNRILHQSDAANSYGIHVVSGSQNVLAENNVIRTTGAGVTAGISFAITGSQQVRHNTIVAENGFLYSGESDLDFQNNIVSAAATCIKEGTAGLTGVRIQNNALNCSFIVFHDADSGCGGTTDCNLAQMEALASLTASGNVTNAPVFLDLSGGDLRLSSSTSVNIREGGLNGALFDWLLTDKSGVTRTASVSSPGPSNTNASGWSMGAFEKD